MKFLSHSLYSLLKYCKKNRLSGLYVFFIIFNCALPATSQTIQERKAFNFSSYYSELNDLGSLIEKTPIFMRSESVFVSRFRESANQVYCEPLSSNLRDGLISNIRAEKVYLEESTAGLPMIVGEYKRILSNDDTIKIRLKMGTFTKEKQQSIVYNITPWISFPTIRLSPKERRCLVKKVIGLPHFVKLSRKTALYDAPDHGSKIITQVIGEPIKLVGYTDEKKYNWWVFIDRNMVVGESRFLYAKNSAQFIIDSNFERQSRDCDFSEKGPKNPIFFKRNRVSFKKNIDNKLSKQGFYYSVKPNLFGVHLLKLCQEINGNDINYGIHYQINGKNIKVFSYLIEFRYEYAGQIKYYDISGEIESLSNEFINKIKKNLIGEN